MLRRIQHLPQRTAFPIVYGLVGQFPIKFELHRRQFILFGNIVREECIEKDLAFWQLLYKLGLPNPYELLVNTPAKSAWKRKVNKKLVEYWKKALVSETQKKSSLQFWNPSSLEYNVCSQIWTCAGRDPVSAHQANIHVKLVSGTYILQTSKAKFNQYGVSSQCPLCGMEPEGLVHFYVSCFLFKANIFAIFQERWYIFSQV